MEIVIVAAAAAEIAEALVDRIVVGGVDLVTQKGWAAHSGPEPVEVILRSLFKVRFWAKKRGDVKVAGFYKNVRRKATEISTRFCALGGNNEMIYIRNASSLRERRAPPQDKWRCI